MTEAIDEIWIDDLLGRREDAEFLKKFLLGRAKERGSMGLPHSYVLNLDAPWGQGKSYFLDRFSQHLVAEGFLVVSVNAWLDDHAEDPLLAVMSAIDGVVSPLIEHKEKLTKILNAVKKHGAAVALAAVKGAALHWTRRAIGEGLEEAIGEWEKADTSNAIDAAEGALTEEISRIYDQQSKLLLSGFKETQSSVQGFRDNLQQLLNDDALKLDGKPIFVFVDELDRCRPTYSVALLERIKHLFDIDNVIFVVATNTEQLCHVISAVYGANFDSQRYLHRFFDRSYVFEEPSLIDFVSSLVRASGIDQSRFSLPRDQKLENFLAGAFQQFGCSLRDAEQCFDMLRSILTIWDNKLRIHAVILVPLIIGQHRGIPLTLDDNFTSKLRALSREVERADELWRFEFSGESSPELQTGFHVFNTFAQMANRSFSEISELRDRSGLQSWIRALLIEEMQTRYRNADVPTGKTYSVVRGYPEYVRSAGRLLPSEG